MTDIRIGNTIDILWRLTDRNTGEPVDLEGRNLKLYCSCGLSMIRAEDFSVEDNTVRWIFQGRDQKNLGTYTLTLVENCGNIGQRVVDVCDIFRLVRRNCYADAGNVVPVTGTVVLEIDSPWDIGIRGDRGLSAYEVAVLNGFQGTETEWLASLKAPALDAVELCMKVEEQVRQAEHTRTEAESQRQLNEQARRDAELKRQQDTSAAILKVDDAVETAVTATDEMNLLYQKVISSENERVKEEQSREAAETQRTEAEAARAAAETERASEFTRLKQESETATASANTAAAAANEAAQGIDTKIAGKQDKTDQSLKTTDKTVAGAINEVYDTLGDINTILDQINGEDAL